MGVRLTRNTRVYIYSDEVFIDEYPKDEHLNDFVMVYHHNS